MAGMEIATGELMDKKVLEAIMDRRTGTEPWAYDCDLSRVHTFGEESQGYSWFGESFPGAKENHEFDEG